MAALSLRWIIHQPVTIIISHQIFSRGRKTYAAEFNICSQSDGNANTVSFEYGTSNSDMTAFSKLSDVTLNDNSEYPAAQKVEIKVNETVNIICFSLYQPTI